MGGKKSDTKVASENKAKESAVKPVAAEEAVDSPIPTTEEVVGDSNNAQVTTTEQDTEQGDVDISMFPIHVRSKAHNIKNLTLRVSKADSVLDVRQFLSEAHETCYFTCFGLELDDRLLNDYTELAQVPGFEPNCTLELVDVPYDERAARLHLRRLRDLLQNPPAYFPTATGASQKHYASREEDSQARREKRKEKAANSTNTTSTTSTANGGSNAVEEITTPKAAAREGPGIDELHGAANLEEFFRGMFCEPNTENLPKCIQSVALSGWNPPPGHRRLCGDLFYLDLVTLDGRTFHISATTRGFLLNQSTNTQFNPEPATPSHLSTTLVELLSQVSAAFKKNFAALLKCRCDKDAFETIAVPFPVVKWMVDPAQHSFDPHRAEEAMSMSFGMDARGMVRDWNEEYQSCKELPKDTMAARVLRDRAYFKVGSDFVDAAIKGAIAVIENNIPPINPMDPPRTHMFLYNSIFFSYAIDTREQYAGGDDTAHKAANNDLQGLIAYNTTNTDGLCTLATVIVDYRGHRVVAQAVIPGILQGDQVSALLYGSVETGSPRVWDQGMHDKLESAGKQLNIKTHKIDNGEGVEHNVAASNETKGLIGADKRTYLLDLVRVTPRDANYRGPEDSMKLLRNELVKRFCAQKSHKLHLAVHPELTPRTEEEAKAFEKAQAEKQKKAEAASSTGEPVEKTEEQLKEEAAERRREQAARLGWTVCDNPDHVFPVALNTDVLTDAKLVGSEEELAADLAEVEDAAKFLLDVVIPDVLNQFKALELTPVDGETLTTYFHTHGINMRYLGRIADLTSEVLPHINTLCQIEMVARTAKYLLRYCLRASPNNLMADTIADFLTCLLGSDATATVRGVGTDEGDTSSANRDKSKKKKKKNASKPHVLHTQETLFQFFRTHISDRFSFTLADDFFTSPLFLSHRQQLLRSVCRRVGVQLRVRHYDFQLPRPFAAADVVDLVPVIKHPIVCSSDAMDYIEYGKSQLNLGLIGRAFEILQEGLSLLHQTCGPMHVQTAQCYNNLALAMYHCGDHAQAVQLQTKGLIIFERVQGVDHPDTAHAFGNIALFYHSMQEHEKALWYLKRAHYLLQLCCGADHPDIAATYINMAMMHQDVGNKKLALRYLNEAREKNETLLGRDHVQTAASYHAIAVAFGTMHMFQPAVTHEKRAYDIHLLQYGENDRRTRQSAFWLKSFEANAAEAKSGKTPKVDVKTKEWSQVYHNGGAVGRQLEGMNSEDTTSTTTTTTTTTAAPTATTTTGAAKPATCETNGAANGAEAKPAEDTKQATATTKKKKRSGAKN